RGRTRGSSPGMFRGAVAATYGGRMTHAQATTTESRRGNGRPSDDRPPVLRTDALTKRYGNRLAVNSLDLEVPAGVVAGFIGPNGAGKTTTMAMLLGLVRPTAGTATGLGETLAEPAAYPRPLR